MTEKIIDLLPSADLKRRIRETGFRFSEAEQLQIILDYAETFDQRMEMLGEFASGASTVTAERARFFAAYERELFRRFSGESDGFVYELHIRYSPDAADEKFICASYGSVLECIDRYYEDASRISVLDIRENDGSKYRIVKRKVYSAGDPFEEDGDSECLLGAYRTLLRVHDLKNTLDSPECRAVEENYDPSKGFEYIGNSCPGCTSMCSRWWVEVRYPCFAFDCAIVKYREMYWFPGAGGRIKLGICLCLKKACYDEIGANDLYVIPMDCEAIRYQQYDRIFDDHEHIPLPEAELVRFEDLDAEKQNNYSAFANWWKENRRK